METHTEMDSSPEQIRKRKQTLASKSLFLCFSFFLTLFFFSSSHHSFYYSYPSSLPNTPIPLHVQDRILFPDHVLLTLSNSEVLLPPHLLCVYYNFVNYSSEPDSVSDFLVRPVLSVDRYDEYRSIARCPLPGKKFTAIDLSWGGDDNHRPFRFPVKPTTQQNWDKLAYEVVIDHHTAVVFVKGLNLRPHKASNPSLFRCHFGPQNGAFWFTTAAVAAAQEAVRCALPQSILNNPRKARGMSVTVSTHMQHKEIVTMHSVAKIGAYKKTQREKKYELCACTMVWNQARAMREWVVYHTWLGVERWFIYDNNSDDDIDNVIRELDEEGYNVSRVTWPWVKTQEAGFSHCSLKAKQECKWVGFFDVDEFFSFNKMQQKNALRSVVTNFSSSSSNSVAEIRTWCLDFGPSGLTTHPKQGVTVGYTCRLRTPQRHKSIIRPDLLHDSLLNVVHHFQLKEGFHSHYMPQSVVAINHYKYQVWEVFKAKFFRRVATYVVDWREEMNIGSRDRTPGLGTHPIEPRDWRLKFCEVWDTRLKDFVLSQFSDSETELLPWERSSE